jgi:hypothetical protein
VLNFLQKHLLEKLMSKDGGNSPRSFIAVVVTTINMISGSYYTSVHSEPVSTWRNLDLFVGEA